MFQLNDFSPFQCPEHEFSTSLVDITNLRKAPQTQTEIKVSFSFWPIMPSSRPLRPALSCSVLWYLTSPRIRCISLDQLSHGLHNPRASRPPGPSLAQLCAGGARLCPLLPSWVSLTPDGAWHRLPLTPAQTADREPEQGGRWWRRQSSEGQRCKEIQSFA